MHTPESLVSWLRLAVQVQEEHLEHEAEHESLHFSQAMATLASSVSIRQQLTNLPLAVKGQLMVAFVLIGIVLVESASLLVTGVAPGALPSGGACIFNGVGQIASLIFFA